MLIVDDGFIPLLDAIRADHPSLRVLLYCGSGLTPPGMVGYDELIESSDPVEDLRLGNEALAALFYTGGTTGHPKGVMHSHRTLITSAMTAQMAEPTCLPGGVILVAAPMFHMAAVQGWVTQQMVGGTFVYLPAFDASAVLETIQRHRVSRMTLVPTMLQMLVDHPDLASYDLDSVHTLGYGASPISATLLERVMATFPRSGVVQGYGMTETGIISLLGREEHREGGPLLRSAGRATPMCDLRVIDDKGAELPPGQIGQVVVRADQVMLGYWGQPELTSETVVDSWMQTGDAGYLDPDGYLFLVDRIKDMIISGGENVYSSEVENALSSHAAVAMCAVIGLPDGTWGEIVHAVVVLKPGTSASADELTEHARARIAGYKVPRSIAFLDALPISAAGKVLKRELRQASGT